MKKIIIILLLFIVSALHGQSVNYWITDTPYFASDTITLNIVPETTCVSNPIAVGEEESGYLKILYTACDTLLVLFVLAVIIMLFLLLYRIKLNRKLNK